MKTQIRTFSTTFREGGKKWSLTVEVSYDGDLSMDANLRELGRGRKQKAWISSPAWHLLFDDVKKHFPELAPAIPWTTKYHEFLRGRKLDQFRYVVESFGFKF